jgi:hypothetical protein
MGTGKDAETGHKMLNTNDREQRISSAGGC